MALIEDILKLSTAERLLLVEKIWDSIATDTPEMTNAQREEMERRYALYKKGEMTFTSWDDVKKSLGLSK